MSLLGKDLLHNLRLGPDRICRDSTSLYIQQFQHFRYRFDLTVLVFYGHLCHHHSRYCINCVQDHWCPEIFPFSIEARNAFPSTARWIPSVLTISPIHSINSSANSSSSIPDRSRHTVDGEAMPFFHGRYFLSSSRCFLHHLRLLRIVVFPARKPATRHTSTSAWSCFVFLPHLGSGTVLIYSSSGFVRNPFSAHGELHSRFFQQSFLLRADL